MCRRGPKLGTLYSADTERCSIGLAQICAAFAETGFWPRTIRLKSVREVMTGSLSGLPPAPEPPSVKSVNGSSPQ